MKQKHTTIQTDNFDKVPKPHFLVWWNSLSQTTANELSHRHFNKLYTTLTLGNVQSIYEKEHSQTTPIEVKEGQHTPGKVQLSPYKKGMVGINFDDPLKASAICQVFGGDKEAEANAERIVECWNGYEALKEQLSNIAGEANASIFQLMGKEKKIKELQEANRELLEVLKGLYKNACDIPFLDGHPDEDFVKAQNDAGTIISKHNK